MRAIRAYSWIKPERGRWVIGLDVLFDDGVVSHRVMDFHNHDLAMRAADWIERCANRDMAA